MKKKEIINIEMYTILFLVYMLGGFGFWLFESIKGSDFFKMIPAAIIVTSLFLFSGKLARFVGVKK